jgi:hypothetical protein
MLAHTASTGSAVAFIDTPRPAMMFVAWPVVDALRDVLAPGVLRAGVVLGDPHQRGRQREADQRAPKSALTDTPSTRSSDTS